MSEHAHLVLVDGTVWSGRPFGARGRRTGEVVFNTSMTGYQEILTDPSYCRQIVVMTAPQIGNTGVNDEDDESDRVWAAGLVVARASLSVSSWRASGSLDDYLAARGIVGITGVDTRALVRHIRDAGAMHGAIVSDGADAAPAHVAEAHVAEALALANSAVDINTLDLVGEVSCAEPYEWVAAAEARWYPLGIGARVVSHHGRSAGSTLREPADTPISSAIAPPVPSPTSPPSAPPIAPPPSPRPHIVVYDFGVKRNTLRLLAAHGCRVTVVPARTPAAQALALSPDGILLSNGPGDPARLEDIVLIVRDLLGRVPIFGICLGHQLLGLALGASAYKLKFGHRGGNQPVRHPAGGLVEISSHNHGFGLDAAGLPADVEVTRTNLNDGCVEGLACLSRRAFSVQYHPEAAPGPHDSSGLFESFLEMVSEGRPFTPQLTPRPGHNHRVSTA